MTPQNGAFWGRGGVGHGSSLDPSCTGNSHPIFGLLHDLPKGVK